MAGSVRLFFLILMSATLSACGAFNNIYWTQGIKDKNGKVFTVDAKQRHLLVNPNVYDTPVYLKNGVYYVQPKSKVTYSKLGPDGKPVGDGLSYQLSKFEETGRGIDVRWRMCAEAPPDVFAAVNSSIAASGGLNAKEKAQFAVGIAEAAGTIERTQTVNLLRESMYRTCERWLSGALTKDQFIIQAARDQRSMVAVLAIEQLTGAVKAKSTIIGAPSTGASVAEAEKLVELMQSYAKERSDAEKKLDTAKAAADAANAVDAKDKDGKVITIADGSNQKLCNLEAPQDSSQQDDFSKCTQTKVTYEAAETEFKNAKKKEDLLLAQAAELSSGPGANTGKGELKEGGLNQNSRVGDVAMVMIADNVERIANAPGLDEPLMFCIAHLTANRDLPVSSPIWKICEPILIGQAEQDLRTKAKTFKISADPKLDRQIRLANFEYLQFRDKLLEAVKGTDANDLSGRLAKFQKSLDAATDLTEICTSKFGCELFVADPENSPYLLSFESDSRKAMDAVRTWLEELS